MVADAAELNRLVAERGALSTGLMARPELGWAAANGATFILLLLLLLPAVPIAGLLRHLKTSRRPASLDRQIHAIVARSGSPLPIQALRGRS